jgi:methionyl-tRNA synthetase
MAMNINSDLANGIGNLLSRTLTMIERFSQGVIPDRGATQLLRIEESLKRETEVLPLTSDDLLSHFRFRDNLESLNWIISLCDELIDESKPWNLAKKAESKPQLNNILNTLAKALRALSIFAFPYMPSRAMEMGRQLGLKLDFSSPLLRGGFRWDDLEPGTRIEKGASLFPRIESKPQGAKTVSDAPATPQPVPAAVPTPQTTASATPATTAPTAPAQITIDDFMKIQLKTAKVLSAERVPKSEKLLKLQVSLGTEQRQIVAGIGKKYEPESLVGKTIVIVANLKPAKLMGIESQGMVLAAGDSEVRGLATILEEVDPGTKVK